MLRAVLLLSAVSFVSTHALAQQPPAPVEPGHEGHDHGAAPAQATPDTPAPPKIGNAIQKHLAPIGFEQVKLKDGFWNDRLEVNRKVTIDACLAKCEETGRIQNFAIAGGLAKGEHKGLLYDDSDVYKVLEGIGYSLVQHRDPALEAKADAIIEKIAAAQRPDGYLNTYYQLKEPDKRWTNIQYGHELYCAGHLFEAAVAYSAATGKSKLLDVAKKLADHIDQTFGPGKKLDPCGHPEVELALVKLSNATGEKRYLNLAKFFVEQRGSTKGRTSFGEYAQDHKPLRDQTEIVGHAVRAMYLYSGAVDVAAATNDDTLLAPLEKIWKDVVTTKMYVTGGIGSSAANEGFTAPYDLPNDSAYCETCASVGMALWNQRMLLATGEAKYGDIVEKELYNGILAGVSADGSKFFYDNPLGSRGDHERVPWFDCSCCPTNIARFLPSIPGLVFAKSGNSIYVSQYVPCEANIEVNGVMVNLKMTTDWPYAGRVNIDINPEKPVTFALKLRRPGWCRTVVYQHDKKEREHQSEFPPGDAAWELYERLYEPNDAVAAHFLGPIRREYAAPEVKADQGRVAICKGPLVYAAEGLDNRGSARSIVLPKEASASVVLKADTTLSSIRAIKAKGFTVDRDALGTRAWRPADVILLPYFQWANRGKSDMTVWLAETPEVAEIPGEGPSVDKNGARITSSHCFGNDSLAAANDGVLPKSSKDETIPRLTFWDHRGSQEWVQYEYATARPIGSSRVYWFDDTGKGSCRAPKSWRITWKDGDAWKPVVLKNGAKYGTALDAPNAVEFEPVTTKYLRLEVELAPEFSGGVLEWEAK